MESFVGRYKNALVLITVLLAQVVLLAMQVRRPAPNMPDGHNVRLWRYWVAEVITPPERVAHDTGLGLRGVWSRYINLRNVRRQNEALQEENDRLRLEQAGLSEDAREGQRLRAMLSFQQSYIQKTVPAQVIGTSGTDQAHVVYIDKGYKDGLRPQMPVITPDGIVGKVKNVFPSTAQVLEISDQTSGAGVMLQTTRIRGVLKGNLFGQPQMINISPDDRIQPGEMVVTSGGDQIYPRGLPVGTVERVVPDPETSYVNVLVKPAANLARLEEVLVVTETSTKMPFGEQKDIMQSEVDALAEKQRAADILSEKLPSIRDENILVGSDATASAGSGVASADAADPSRPVRPPSALHPDRYTPGATPAAAMLSPAQGPAHRERPAAEVGSASAQPVARPTRPASDLSGAPSPAVARAARPAASSTGGSASTGLPASSAATTTTARASSGAVVAQPGASAPRRTVTPLLGETTGGANSILTPAGMGTLIRPRITVPAHPANSPGVAGAVAGAGTSIGSMARPSATSAARGVPQVDTSGWHFTPQPAGHGATTSGGHSAGPKAASGVAATGEVPHRATPGTGAAPNGTLAPKKPAPKPATPPQGGR